MIEPRYFNEPIGYWLSKIDPALLQPLYDEIAEFEQQVPRDQPHGVNHKFDLKKSRDYIADIVGQHIAQYNLENNYPNSLNVLNEPRPLKLYNLWVNFMSRYQYEPIHDHGGVMSFVMWVRVPYTMQSEAEARPYVPPQYNTSGGFGLHSTNSIGRLQNIVLPVDKTWENTLCVFPARMQHSVFPFYSSDELRVSIAGNFFFDGSNQGKLE
jgi:hypothetical protein